MESEQLVQRFVDQELSAEECIRFVSRLGRDESLRQRVIELEQLTVNASRLPRIPVPADFGAKVMARIEAERIEAERIEPVRIETERSPRRSLLDLFLAPRPLQWNFAGASAVAVLAAIIVWGAFYSGASTRRSSLQTAGPGSSSPGSASGPGAPAAAGAASSTVLVRLVVVEPGAMAVQVAGDFNGWNPAVTSLEQTAEGAWTVMLPLQPGRYEYKFVVDGEWIADPFAAEHNDDGFGSSNAVLEVRPPADNVRPTL